MITVLTILALVILFKITGFVFKITSKLIGAIFSLIVFGIVAAIVVPVLGLALFMIPVALVFGVISIVCGAAKIA